MQTTTPPGRTRGYFGIGAEGVSKSANVGALLRTAHAFGASFCFTLGTGFDARAGRTADTSDTPVHVPLWRFDSAAELHLPKGCQLVGIEIHEDAAELPSFRHPLSAAYVLGPERSSLSPALLARCEAVEARLAEAHDLLALAAGVALLPSGVPALPLAIRERIAAWLRAQEPPR